MGEEPTTGYIVLYAVLIVVTMAVLDWLESKRTRTARARRDRDEQLDARPARKAA
jgi:hypothetical protein